jgi:hypothetical protein
MDNNTKEVIIFAIAVVALLGFIYLLFIKRLFPDD